MNKFLVIAVLLVVSVLPAWAQVGQLNLTLEVSTETGKAIFNWQFLSKGLTPQQAIVNVPSYLEWEHFDIVGIVYMKNDLTHHGDEPWAVFDYASSFNNFDAEGNAGPLVSDGIGKGWQGEDAQYDLATYNGSITMVFHHGDRWFWLNTGMVAVYFNGGLLDYSNEEYTLWMDHIQPEVTGQNHRQTVMIGVPARLTVVTIGGAVDYQWFLKEEFGDWSEMPDTNSSTYDFLSQKEGVWWLKCKATNDKGEAESVPAMVTVTANSHELSVANLASLALLCGSVILVAGGTLRRHN